MNWIGFFLRLCHLVQALENDENLREAVKTGYGHRPHMVRSPCYENTLAITTVVIILEQTVPG